MILSRVKSDSATSRQSSSGLPNKRAFPDFEEFLIKRDYTGARTKLEFGDGNKRNELLTKQWLVFCDFHLGNYKKALDQYENLKQSEHVETKENDLNIAVCMFYLGMYTEAQAIIETIPNSPLKIRLLFHLAHKLNDEDRLMELHGSLRDVTEDQLSLASMHYLRAHYQDAIDIYKRILLDKKDYLALNIYVGLCYYKLDYYDISQEVLDLYLVKHPDSTIAINLKACNRFRLANGRAAELELKNLTASDGIFGADLIRHNLVVFRNGEGALQVLPSLVDIIPEARLNLAIHYLRNNDIYKAEELMKPVQPTVPSEYILKGVVHSVLGQKLESKEHLKSAQQYLHLVGGSASECDTIPGRQSMASAFFLYGQFEEVLVYLNSIRSFFINNDAFNYNYAQAKAATGYYKEAEELLVQINDPDIRAQPTFGMVLARCHIYCGHADQAWNLYVTKDTNDSFGMLQLIASECFRVGEFWIAAKAFDMLEKFTLDPNPEYWEGKRGACIGALYSVITERSAGIPPGGMMEICSLLRDSANPQAESIIRSIRRFCSEFN